MNRVVIVVGLAICVWVAVYIPEVGAPAAVFCLALAALAGLLIVRATPTRERKFLLLLFTSGLVLRMLVGVLIYILRLQEFFGGDALTYDYAGSVLLSYYQSELRYSADDGLAMSREWGMPYLVAGVYYLLGRNLLAMQFVNAVVGAATPVVVYFCAHQLFVNIRVARISGILVAFYPSLVLWSSQGLKDGPIVFLLALSMLMTLRLGERLSVSRVVILGGALLGVLSLRFYIFYMLVVAVGAAFIIGTRQLSAQSMARQAAALITLGLALTYFGVLRTADRQLDAYANLQAIQNTRSDLARSAQSGFGSDLDVSTTSGALTAIPLGLLYLLFAPFPWQLANLRQLITLPEMIVWWASFPLLVLGAWYAINHRLRVTLPILSFTTMLSLAYSLMQGNVGTAYRQRSQLLVFYFIFVAVGYVLIRERQEERQRQATLAKQELVQRAAQAAAARRRHQRRQHEDEKELKGAAEILSARAKI